MLDIPIQSHIPLDLIHLTRRPTPNLGSGASIRFIASEECAGASFTAKSFLITASTLLTSKDCRLEKPAA